MPSLGQNLSKSGLSEHLHLPISQGLQLRWAKLFLQDCFLLAHVPQHLFRTWSSSPWVQNAIRSLVMAGATNLCLVPSAAGFFASAGVLLFARFFAGPSLLPRPGVLAVSSGFGRRPRPGVLGGSLGPGAASAEPSEDGDRYLALLMSDSSIQMVNVPLVFCLCHQQGAVYSRPVSSPCPSYCRQPVPCHRQLARLHRPHEVPPQRWFVSPIPQPSFILSVTM